MASLVSKQARRWQQPAARVRQRAIIGVGLACAVLGADSVGALVEAGSAGAAPSNYVILVVPPGGTAPPVSYQYQASSLADAQAAVQQHNGAGDVTVELASGTFTLTAPLTFGTADGGQGGFHVTWEAAPGATPIISGGQPVTGWTLTSGSTYQANVGVGTNTRNLYVNGLEAAVAGSPIAGSAAASLATVTTTGFTVTNTTLKSTLAAATDVSQMEIEHRGTWTDHYCPVASITNAGGTINMAQPCWENNIMGWDTGRSTGGDYIENNLAFLNKPNEFYLASDTGVLYYDAPTGTTLAGMNSLNVVLPLVQSLVTISGSHANPVRNLTFQGIEFENSSWLLPSQPGGYADQQQDYFSFEDYTQTITTANGYPANYSYPSGNGSSTGAPFEASRPRWYEVPGAIQVSAATGVTFAGDTFTDLGSAALGIGEDAEDMTSGVPYDAQNITIANNTFTQIAATGVMIGGINYPAASAPANPAYDNENIVVENNSLTNLGTNYLDSDGVEVNNTTHAVVSNNYIHNAPYDGVATGFGWGAYDPGGSSDYNGRGSYTPAYFPVGFSPIVPVTATPQQYTVITNNSISDTGLGTSSFSCCAGPFYNLSASPFGVFSGNYMFGNNPGQGGLYEDEGSRFNTYYDNVIQDATSWAGVNSSSTNNADDNAFVGNWHNNASTVNSTTGMGNPHYNVVFANPLVAGTAWPLGATQVINNAGLVAGLGYPAPTITTLGQATMTAGAAGSYSLFASGAPTPSFAETGALPGGVTFTDNGDGTATLAGTPAAGSAGAYPLSITASNGAGSAATQAFTLTVLAQAPTATTVAVTGRVTNAAGLPLAGVCANLYLNPTAATPAATACTRADGSYEMDGVVPGALLLLDTYHYLVQFVDPSGTYSTAWYNGTPSGAQTEATANAIQLEGRLGSAITGINAVMSANAAPNITSAASLTTALSVPINFVMTASGSPWATFTKTGTLPSGVTLTSEGDGTALLSGTPAATSAGTYVLAVSAANGINPAATQTFTLTIVGPTTAATVAPTTTTLGYYTTLPTVTLSASETGGVIASTSYMIDGAAVQTYLTPFQVPDGTHTITYYSTDSHNNKETPHTLTLKVDVTAPTTTATLNPAAVAGIVNGNPTVTLSANDNGGSGVASTLYSLDGGTWTTYTAPFPLSGGAHVLKYYSVDAVGNAEAVNTLTVQVNPTATTSPMASVASTLGVTMSGVAPTFGAFTPGSASTYTTTATATVTSTAAGATFTASDTSAVFPGRLVNNATGGPYALAQGLQVAGADPINTAGSGVFTDLSVTNPATLLTFSAPVANDPVTVTFRQPIAGTDPLRTGAYTKTITLTLSTSTP